MPDVKRQRALKRSKSMERKVAKAFGSQRVYQSGGLHAQEGEPTNADVHHPILFIECKSWHSWKHHSVFGAVRGQARSEGKIPVLVTHIPGRPGNLVTVDLEDFIKITDGGQCTCGTTTTKSKTTSGES